MAAINYGGTFYRLDESSQSGDCGEANVMALHLASKQVMPLAFAAKCIPFGKASLKLKRKATASEQDHSRPSLHAMPPERLAAPPRLLPTTHFKEVILSRRPFNEGVKGCTRAPQPLFGLAVLPIDPALKNNRLPIGTRSGQSLFL